MNTLRQAAQQALEALEEWHGAYPHRVEEDDIEVAEALRAALAEPEDDALTAAYMLGRHDSKWCPIHQHYKWCEHNGGVMGPTGWEKPMQQGCQHCNQPLYAAVKCRVCGRVISAEPVQEPVAWSYELATTMLEHGYDGWEHRITRYKPNVPEGSIRNLTPLYTAPPQRKPLTEKEIDQIADHLDATVIGWSTHEFTREIERAHEIGE